MKTVCWSSCVKVNKGNCLIEELLLHVSITTTVLRICKNRDTYDKFNIFLRGASLQVSRDTHYLLEKQFKMYIFCQTTAFLLYF